MKITHVGQASACHAPNVAQASACHASDVGQASACQRTAPRGFTLVEVMVVLVILSMLAALLTPVLMRSMQNARNVATKTEIDMLHMAIMNYKSDYGSFPPANMAGLWNSTANQVNTTHPVYRHLQKLFPRIAESTSTNASPYFYMAQMSPAQALVFWLQGFYENPQYPLTNNQALSPAFTRTGAATGTRKKYFDFDERRLYAASTTAPQTFASRSTFTTGVFEREYPVYMPNRPSPGVPFVYFSNNTYSTPPTASNRVPDVGYYATSLNGGNTAVWPYFVSDIPNDPSWATCHLNGDTFQIISGGADGSYGPYRLRSDGSVERLPAAFPSELSALPFTDSALTLPIPAASVAEGHADNITNFASAALRDAADKILQK